MTGGGALLYGLDKLIQERTGIPTNIAENPIECVAIGTGKSLDWVDMLDNKMIDSESIRR